MPEISRFLGIVIAMYYRDHAPPYFHAIYGDFEVTVEISSFNQVIYHKAPGFGIHFDSMEKVGTA